MNERSITLEDINVKDFFGISNQNFNELKKYYPKLKLVARGNKVYSFGEAAILDEFEKNLDRLVSYFQKYKKVS